MQITLWAENSGVGLEISDGNCCAKSKQTSDKENVCLAVRFYIALLKLEYDQSLVGLSHRANNT